MLSEEITHILETAYIPEHSVNLMAAVSEGTPMLKDGFFFLVADRHIILIGYPLNRSFDLERFTAFLEEIKEKFRPEQISMIAPMIPETIREACVEYHHDEYYLLALDRIQTKSATARNVRKAGEALHVERCQCLPDGYLALFDEFYRASNPPARVRLFLKKLPLYLRASSQGLALIARDRDGNLSAIYIIDTAPKTFLSYLIGCYSRTHYIRGASDLLMAEMVGLGIEMEKKHIHLGLGVNDGIRRFKEKWGGYAAMPYHMGALMLNKPSISNIIWSLKKKK